MRQFIGSLGIALAAVLFQFASIQQSQAGCAGGCCEKCGCDDCDVCCKLVCETKKVPKVKYCCKCEDFCVPHECPTTTVHECEAPKCECDSCCNHECGAETWLKNLFHCDNAHAGCADSIGKKKLVKFVEQKEVPVYKWVAEKHCHQCGCCSECDACGMQGVPSNVPNAAPAAPSTPMMPQVAPMPAGDKSALMQPQVNVPAGFHVSDEDASSKDPVFRAFFKK